MKHPTHIPRLLLSVLLSLVLCLSSGGTWHAVAEDLPGDAATDALYERFQTPPRESKSRPLWFWNSEGRHLSDITKEGIREIMVGSNEQSGYFGFGILPNWLDNYMSDAYLELYGYALEVAKELGMKMCLYDEDGFPSGTAGGSTPSIHTKKGNGVDGLLAQNFPESTLKRLDKSETDVAGPASVTLAIPQGAYRTYLGAVAMNTETHEILDISDTAVFVGEMTPGVFASTSHPAVGGETFGPERAFDGDHNTRWNAGATLGVDQWLEVRYETDTTVDKVVIREALGRIRSYAVQYHDGDGWVDLATGATIGALRELSFPAVTARRFRLMIYTTSAPTDSASIYEVELFHGDAKLPVLAVGDNFDRVVWEAPAGSWKVMAFATVKDGISLVDYLSGEAVDDFISTTHDVYYEHFPEYFGTVIDSAFYDEPTLQYAEGRTWTGRFNELFEAAHGYSPVTLYPALWYDIGDATASARNALFGFRTELFSTQYIKRLNDWCRAHGIALTGHMLLEENVNPTTSSGDMLKIFSHQDIPGVDEIASYDNALKAYKLVSSSAYNWDKGLVMTETYGGMGENMGIPVLYKDIMNQLVRGINYVVPHAIWYNNKQAIDNPPELSFRSARYGPELPAYNDFIGRVSGLLQNGRHVADIGVVYPIHTLQATTQFDVGNPLYGVAPEEADYMDLGHTLSTTLRRDFTYLHPEIIAERCEADGDTFRLQNEVNYENYKVLVMPGAKTISLAAL
ncbi:MAG: discoidin domain-containing protein, partial [Oscillospiraceae bacterium]|nr:discoidin domain-containing protein [Oscillospiraceae bacterium]